MTPPLKIIACDTEDLAIVSACLQDALIPLNEMRYLPQERRFIMVANRFRWERAAQDKQEPALSKDASFEGDDDFGALQRTNAGICIDRVLAVRSRGIDRSKPNDFLSLLSVQLDGNKVSFLFAGGGTIQVEVEGLALYLSDLGKAWPTQWQPDHAVNSTDKATGR
ncbi:DUF2948 family protein [Dongia deserti]|uniref:DUF2948 family protein n=1 Tax=Dongia deserti TaxID=2268030 RepID=UPI000E656078|nr:DUF2948 family protein [Dongia deserti]